MRSWRRRLGNGERREVNLLLQRSGRMLEIATRYDVDARYEWNVTQAAEPMEYVS